MNEICLGLLFVSLLANGFLAWRLINKKHVLNQDAKALLAEIMSGSAVIKIQVIDPTGLFYRSPKG